MPLIFSFSAADAELRCHALFTLAADAISMSFRHYAADVADTCRHFAPDYAAMPAAPLPTCFIVSPLFIDI